VVAVFPLDLAGDLTGDLVFSFAVFSGSRGLASPGGDLVRRFSGYCPNALSEALNLVPTLVRGLERDSFPSCAFFLKDDIFCGGDLLTPVGLLPAGSTLSGECCRDVCFGDDCAVRGAD
jgi:hypothetical protein